MRRALRVTRREALLLGASLGLAPVLASCKEDLPTTPQTIGDWKKSAGAMAYVGHRGSADTTPEHTVDGYEQALAGGAKAIEISACLSSDGALVCMHDLTLDRTTNLQGAVARYTAAQLTAGRVVEPRLGPAWQGANAPHLPLLEDVLKRFAGRAVMCVEAKDDKGFPAMLDLLKKYNLKDSAFVKLHFSSNRFDAARSAGFAIFGYLGSIAEATSDAIDTLAGQLKAESDVLTLPASEGLTVISDDLVKRAIASGVPVWMFPVHRRWERDHYAALGVTGVVTGSAGYVSGSISATNTTSWVAGKLDPGTITLDPLSESYGPAWVAPGVISLAANGVQSFIAIANLAKPDAPSPVRLSFEARVRTMPNDLGSNISLAFGHADDRYYEHRQGKLDGYHAIARFGGGMEIFRHTSGSPDGAQLAATGSDALVAGQWVPLKLELSASGMTWSRPDTGDSCTTTTTSPIGYVHVGRASTDGAVDLRNVTLVTQ